MALETTNYQCPSCNGPLHFVGNSGKLECDYCGSSFTVEEVEKYYAEKQAKADERAAKAAEKEAKAKEKAEKGSAGAQAENGEIPAGAAGAGAAGAGAAGAGAGAAAAAGAATAAGAGATGAGTAAAAAGASTEAGAGGAAAAAGAAGATAEAPKTHRKQPVSDDPIQNYISMSEWEKGEEETLRAYTCSSCGAQLMADETTAVTSCPYCGNPTVLPGQLSGALKPEYVIPFRYDKKAAVDALKSYYNGKKFLPDSFANSNHLEEIQGVYVPFWLFTADAQGNANFSATKVMTWSDSKNNYTKTDYYNASRLGKMHFEKVPVDGSTRMPDAHMDAIEPFDYNELTPFSMGYLPGYLTDRYDQDAKDCQIRAVARIRETTEDTLRGTVTGYSTVTTKSCTVKELWDNASYALLPVWMLHTRWNDQDFLFAMNGQTGKLIGDLPVEKSKVVKRFLMISIPILLVYAILVAFFMGGLK